MLWLTFLSSPWFHTVPCELLSWRNWQIKDQRPPPWLWLQESLRVRHPLTCFLVHCTLISLAGCCLPSCRSEPTMHASVSCCRDRLAVMPSGQRRGAWETGRGPAGPASCERGVTWSGDCWGPPRLRAASLWWLGAGHRFSWYHFSPDPTCPLRVRGACMCPLCILQFGAGLLDTWPRSPRGYRWHRRGGETPAPSPVSLGRACVTVGGGKWVLQSHCHQESPESSLAPLWRWTRAVTSPPGRPVLLPKTEGELSPGADERRVRSDHGCQWSAPRTARDPGPARAELGVGFWALLWLQLHPILL